MNQSLMPHVEPCRLEVNDFLQSFGGWPSLWDLRVKLPWISGWLFLSSCSGILPPKALFEMKREWHVLHQRNGGPKVLLVLRMSLGKGKFTLFSRRIGSLCRKRYNGPIKYPRTIVLFLNVAHRNILFLNVALPIAHSISSEWAWTMSPEQSQYIWRKTIPHIEVGMGSGVFTSHRSARNL